MANRIVNKSISLPRDFAEQTFGDVNSSVMAKVGDDGNREAGEDDDDLDKTESLICLDSEKHLDVGIEIASPHDDASSILSRGFGAHDHVGLRSPVSPSTEEIMSSLERNQLPLVQPSLIKDEECKLPKRVDYCNYLIHLSIFGFLGALTRYSLQKLFGPSHFGLTSTQTALYLDLPANILGSFFMGWLGVVFKTDIRRFSDHLIVGLTTGYLGSLTTFSGWNQQMLDLSSKGQWAPALGGIVLGMFIVYVSIALGVYSAEGLRKLLVRWSDKNFGRIRSKLRHCRIDAYIKHAIMMAFMFIMLLAVWFLSAAFAILKFRNLEGDAVLWVGCLVAPTGVWARWHLARLNGVGLGKDGYLKWLPIGTLSANVVAAFVMAALAAIIKAVNTKGCTIIISGIQFGFLGCLSTVSTFAGEVYDMIRKKYRARAFVYIAATFIPSFAFGTLIYSVPVWKKHYN